MQAGTLYQGQGEEIVNVGTVHGVVAVYRENDLYQVVVDGVIRHPRCGGEDVMRALANYLFSMNYALSKHL